MQSMLRPFAIGIAFAVLVGGGLTALTHSGETKEAGLVEDACAKAAWPLIPAKCLDGGRRSEVRVVGSAPELAVPTGLERFRSDFE
jgi:hypothetical protein